MVVEVMAVAKQLQELQSKLQSCRKEDRIALSSYLKNISDCISDICDRYQNKLSLNDRCSEMEEYGRESAKIINKVIGGEKGERLAESIARATYSRRGLAPHFFFLDINFTQPENRLAELHEAAGMLRATSNILKAPVPEAPGWWGRLKQIVLGSP